MEGKKYVDYDTGEIISEKDIKEKLKEERIKKEKEKEEKAKELREKKEHFKSEKMAWMVILKSLTQEANFSY